MNVERVKVLNPYQIINMGGPWIGDLFVDDIYISSDIIVNNYIDSNQVFYFVKYNKVSERQVDNFFTILRLDVTTTKIDISMEIFDKIYIENVIEDTLYYYNGFHNKLPLVNIKLNFSAKSSDS